MKRLIRTTDDTLFAQANLAKEGEVVCRNPRLKEALGKLARAGTELDATE